MKRVMVVLLSIAGLVFAQTGEVFTKIVAGGLDEANTGFKVNYDAFGLEYKFVEKSQVLGVDTYSPGYFNITGIKAGLVTIGFGITPKLGYDTYAVTKNSNGLVTALSDGGKTKFAYSLDLLPRIAVNIGTVNVTTSDQSEILFAESIVRTYQITNAGTNVTENADAALYKRELRTKIGANMKGLWNGEFGGYVNPYWKWEQAGAGSYSENFSLEINNWGDYTLPLGSSLDLYIKHWIQYNTSNNMVETRAAPGITNNTYYRDSTLKFGPEVRLQYKIAGGQVKLNAGIGLASQILSESYNGTNMLNNVATNIEVTNAQETWFTLYGVKRDDNRALLEFGGSTKFGDWEFGLNGRLSLTVALYTKVYNPVTKEVTEQVLNDIAPWSEPLFIPLVKTLYLKYSKGMFSVTFNLINPDQERGSYEDTAIGFGTDATKRWFYSVDFNYKF
ncbi:hypothetical protein [Thermospira aquatica]|uniref:Outer membrane protein n=1 Tax=Thermospira aquatica TaxID=2828656 RepID=A0AAX3BF16_9SPIR|nr:hypothetical protein [Thermospira aquatica]URA10806.1 hypothetical protein KDW03_03095 [Thermospira aquatica]